MKGVTNREFLPFSHGARIAMFLLALPSSVGAVSILVLYSVLLFRSPPPGLSGILAGVTVIELSLVAVLITIASLIWSIATPKWLQTLLALGTRRLVNLTGIFLVMWAPAMALASIACGDYIPMLFAMASLAIGVRILYVASRRGWPYDHPEQPEQQAESTV